MPEETDLELLDENGELLIGALAGYTVGGGAGALAGAYIAHNWK